MALAFFDGLALNLGAVEVAQAVVAVVAALVVHPSAHHHVGLTVGLP